MLQILTVCLLLLAYCTEAQQNQICQVRLQALNAAGKLLPACRRGEAVACEAERTSVYQTLSLIGKCQIPTIPARIAPLGNEVPQALKPAGQTYFVSASGSDSNNGLTRGTAFLTLAKALTAAATRPVAQMKLINILSGEYHIPETLRIGPQLSNLAIVGESTSSTTRPKLTAGLLIPRATNPCINFGTDLVQCTIDPSILSRLGPLSQLFVNGQAAIRGRTPNINTALGEAYDKRRASKWGKGKPLPIGRTVNRVIIPSDDPNVRYQPGAPRYDEYSMGFVDETKVRSPFYPNGSYFLDPNHVAQGGCVYTVPTSATWRKTTFSKTWAKPKTALFHALHWYGWGVWTFSVATQSTKSVTFGEGGWQEARGDCGKGGQFWYAENVLELVDAPNEYFLDFEEGKLYYFPRDDASNPALNSDVTLELTAQIRNIMHIVGDSSSQLASNVTIRNVDFFGSYPTTMDRFEVPSGGDWSFHRSGALHIEQVSNIVVEDCGFKWNGGNGLMVGRRARNIRIIRNSFFALGASAILVVGDPGIFTPDPWVIKDYPEDVRIEGNVASYIGLHVKQTSAVFISLARSVVVEGNVFYWGPRAGITMNDQWGGNNRIYRNVVYEFVRSTSDHGPFILWHRQMFADPVIKGFDVIEENLFIGTPGVGKDGGGKGINIDDGGHKVLSVNNVLAVGFHKMKGDQILVFGNLIIQPVVTSCVYFSHFNRIPARQQFINNTCLTSNFPPYALGVGGTGLNALCQDRDNFIANRNAFYTSNPVNKLEGCMKSWSVWRTQWRNDVNSILSNVQPSLDAINAMILERLPWIPRP